MKTHAQIKDSRCIVYDAEAIRDANPCLFDSDYWRGQGRVVSEARGRGSTLMLDTDFGGAVLRQYLRGGWAARFSRDRYLFTGFGRSRPMAEFTILETLAGAGLPVPPPLAAMCEREGALYRGWLLMRSIDDSETLAERLWSRRDTPENWLQAGACIRRFHDFGLVHADLNARNILVDGQGAAHLIDFDRARLRPGARRAFGANLQRLHRSLTKIWPEADRGRMDACWAQLLEGYRQSVAAR